MQVDQAAFAPEQKGTKNLSVTASSGNVQWRTNTNARAHHCQIYNPSATVIVFVEFGSDNTVAASTTASIPVAPGRTVILSGAGDWVAAIGSAAGPTTVYFTPGYGGLS